jgi:hypothetical protein
MIDKVDPNVEDIPFMWPIILSKRLGYTDDQIKIWARNGASCKDIALTAIEAMHKYNGVFVICWTWPERTPYWDNTVQINTDQEAMIVYPSFIKSIDEHSKVKKYPELVEHFVKFEGYKNWTINFLMHFNLVNMTAKALNKKCIHIQIGGQLFDLNDMDWFSVQTIPSYVYSQTNLPTNNPYIMSTPQLTLHSLYTEWLTTEVLFRELSLYETIVRMTDRDPRYYNRFHWSTEGSKLVADVLYDSIKNIFNGLTSRNKLYT